MALMKLLRLPTEDELEQEQIDFEGFYQTFISQTIEPFTAKVTANGNKVDLEGYTIHKADWFAVIDK